MNLKQLFMFVLPIVKQKVTAILQKVLGYFVLPSAKQLLILTAVRMIGLYLAMFRLLFLIWTWLRCGERKYFWSARERTSPPACLLSSSLGRHRFAKLKGIKLHYVECGDKKKPLLLCLHGFPEVWYSWKHQLRTFSKTNWVVAADMRGYGDSDKPRNPDQYHLSILVEDIRQLILELGKETCVLMGHDLGAAVGWLFAAIHPNMLTHFIALSCPHPAVLRHYTKNLPSWRQLYLSRHSLFFQVPWIPELVMKSRDTLVMEKIAKVGFSTELDSSQEVEAYKFYFSRQGAWNGPLNYYRKMFSSQSCIWMSEAQLRVRIPTLLIFGENDWFFSQETVLLCSKHVDQLHYDIIDGASRWVQRKEPEKVNRLVAKFLNGTF